jgi:hypothetical protein
MHTSSNVTLNFPGALDMSLRGYKAASVQQANKSREG